jgi:hypothetical protein
MADVTSRAVPAARRLVLAALVVLIVLALPVTIPSGGRGTEVPDCPDPAAPGLGARPVHLVTDLDAVQPRESASKPRLLEFAGQVRAGSVPAVAYNADREGDPGRYLYDEGVALRRIAGVLGYAYAATKDPGYLDAMAAGVARNAAQWPDWNAGHPLDTAQIGTAVALAYNWSRDRVAEPDRAAVTRALVSRLIEPYLCGEGALRAQRSARGNQATVVGTAVALAGLAVRDDAPRWAAAAVAAAGETLAGNRAIESGPTVEGLMYTHYEAASLALLWSTLWHSQASPAVAAALSGRLPSLDALAEWSERFGRVAEPKVADGWDLYPWVDRATGLAAMSASPGAGPHVLELVEGLQAVDTLTVPGGGSWPVPDGIAELVLSGVTSSGTVAPPVQAHAPAGPAYPSFWGGATNGPLYALMTATPNNAAHSHQDVGNVVVKHGEQTVLDDLGQRDYTHRAQGPVWRSATKPHNTIGVLELDGRVTQQRSASGTVSTQQGGLLMSTSDALPRISWQRAVTLDPATVRVRDTLTALEPGTTTLSMSWLLPVPPAAVTKTSGGQLRYALPDGSTWELDLPDGTVPTYSDAAPSPPYVDSPGFAAEAGQHTLVVVPLSLDGALELATEVRKVS